MLTGISFKKMQYDNSSALKNEVTINNFYFLHSLSDENQRQILSKLKQNISKKLT